MRRGESGWTTISSIDTESFWSWNKLCERDKKVRGKAKVVAFEKNKSTHSHDGCCPCLYLGGCPWNMPLWRERERRWGLRSPSTSALSFVLFLSRASAMASWRTGHLQKWHKITKSKRYFYNRKRVRLLSTPLARPSDYISIFLSFFVPIRKMVDLAKHCSAGSWLKTRPPTHGAPDKNCFFSLCFWW